MAVLFWRLGPYHLARLNAAAKLLDVFAIEACGMDDIYGWEKVTGKESFTRITLTDRQIQLSDWNLDLCRQMRRALKQINPQAVVIPGWSFGDALSGLAWCIETRTPAVVMSESAEGDERRTEWKEWVKRRIARICSAALVGGTPHEDYMKKLGMPPERIFRGYDAVDNNYFADGAAELRSRRAEISAKHGLPANYFLASARFVEKKNLPRLIQAYSLYRKKSQAGDPVAGQRPRVPAPWDLVIVGDGPLKPELCGLISELGLQDCVLLPGFKQYGELPVYYAFAGAFVHASTTEQWGLVVNEAMASGLPVLVSNRCGCATDLVREGRNGFTFDPSNVEELSQLMLRVSAVDFSLAAFGAASARIIADWGPERFASGLKAAAETVIGAARLKPTLLERAVLKSLLVNLRFAGTK
ncbi:MAG TPA: glycosyltransferase [Candidatus Baltobacteraceae bacterium]|nr:glycosyltransferase [Candidatus Baltobacteraceae bacterium]